MPLISICIPTYNRRQYLEETLNSVFRQTFKDYEVVILDDGSTDGTEEWIKSRNWPVRYYKQANRGDAGAKNKLIELAEGQYISFLDSDDLLFDDAIECLFMTVKHRADCIAYGSYVRIDEQGRKIGIDKRRLYSGLITEYLFQDIFVHPSGSLFPKNILAESGRFNESIPVCSDYQLFLALSMKYEFIALPKPTFYRRRHSTNLSGYSARNRKVELEVVEDFYFHKGGQSLISEKMAHRRLAQQSYRAGKCAIQDKNIPMAKEMLRKSLSYSYTAKSLYLFLKTLFYK